MIFTRSFLLVSARTTAKRLCRGTSGLLLLLAFTLPASAVDLLYAALSSSASATQYSVATFDVTIANAITIQNSKQTIASGLAGTYGLTFDSSGNLFATNQFSGGSITQITPGGVVSTFINSGLSAPTGIAFDAVGDMYVSNWYNNTISKITPGGATSTFLGGASGINNPTGLAFDAGGNLYVANEAGNNVLKVTPGGSVFTFASGLNAPQQLVFDSSGNLYVANYGNNTVKMINSGGVVSTYVVSSAGLNGPSGLAFDTTGNLYVSNWNGGGSLISKVNSSGAIVLSFNVGTAPARFLSFGATSVPEPSTYALAAIAAGVMGVIARRRKARQS